MSNQPEAHTFEAGKTYYGRFMSNYDQTHEITIIRRTAKTVWFEQYGEVVHRRVGHVGWCNSEAISPFGTYSMSMSIYAREVIE